MKIYVLKQWHNDVGWLNIRVTFFEDEAQEWLSNGGNTPDKNRDYDVFDVSLSNKI